MTAPELVEVVAGALAKHAVPAWGADGKTGTCFCSEPINAERPTIHARTRALSAHQARAVLAALTEAGEVEWGIFRKDEAGNTWTPMENARFKTLAKAESYRKNMFLPAFQEIIEPRFRHVGPWQKLEE